MSAPQTFDTDLEQNVSAVYRGIIMFTDGGIVRSALSVTTPDAIARWALDIASSGCGVYRIFIVDRLKPFVKAFTYFELQLAVEHGTDIMNTVTQD